MGDGIAFAILGVLLIGAAVDELARGLPMRGLIVGLSAVAVLAASGLRFADAFALSAIR
ncbi:hypothetical protein [Klebsiella pneumoniae]|jgi:hypothetical protein|uniref:hypothetical protein n=1 Tax=Klebsiella pneumoniae TaxID=573 RepID=UPI003563E274